MSNLSNVIPKVYTGLSQVFLKGLPISVTSGDVRRAIKLAGLVGVTDVSLVYRRFLPLGQALLTLSDPEFTRDAVRAAQNITFTGCEEIRASATADQYSGQRYRGIKGRADALKRGLLGSGPSAGFPAGRTVTITGIPGRVSIQNFRLLVQGFQLADDEENCVLQVPLPEDKFSMFGRFVVVLASESEAQRLVRKLHFTCYKGSSNCMTAAVIY